MHSDYSDDIVLQTHDLKFEGKVSGQARYISITENNTESLRVGRDE